MVYIESIPLHTAKSNFPTPLWIEIHWPLLLMFFDDARAEYIISPWDFPEPVNFFIEKALLLISFHFPSPASSLIVLSQLLIIDKICFHKYIIEK